jgi:hypothetical protein
VSDSIACPFFVALDPEVVVCLCCQAAHSAGAFKDPLRQRNTRRNFILHHFLNGNLFVCVYVVVNVGFGVLGEKGERRKGEKEKGEKEKAVCGVRCAVYVTCNLKLVIHNILFK